MHRTPPAAADRRGRRLVSARLLAAAAAVVALPLVSQVASAADFIWDGGAGSSNWTTAGNWRGGTAPANNATADVIFPGATAFNVSYVNQNYFIDSLAFTGLRTNFLLSSNNATLRIGGGGLQQASTFEQQINAPARLMASQVWVGSNTGRLNHTGVVSVGNDQTERPRRAHARLRRPRRPSTSSPSATATPTPSTPTARSTRTPAMSRSAPCPPAAWSTSRPARARPRRASTRTSPAATTRSTAARSRLPTASATWASATSAKG